MRAIVLNALPVALMLALIPLVSDDYILTVIYIIVIVLAFLVRYEPIDFTALLLGIVLLTGGEYLFISTGVEVFERRTLFEVMPLWLPLLWGYCFVAIKRVVLILRSVHGLY